MIVHCLFEQSGTFKNAFRKYGVEAYDYDIQNEFGQTDYQVDLFKEIEGGYLNKPSLFDKIKEDDKIIAFFPCTRFEAKIPLNFRGQAYQQKNWSDIQKLKYSIKLHKELDYLYEKISQLCVVCLRKNIQIVIENPYTQPHYLTTYWCLKPTLIDKDRTKDGDFDTIAILYIKRSDGKKIKVNRYFKEGEKSFIEITEEEYRKREEMDRERQERETDENEE